MLFFAERSEPFEWKLHGHDRPADLPERLRAAGLAPEDTETVVIGRVDKMAAEPSLPDGVVIREVSEPGDFARIAELEESVWHKDHRWVNDLAEERAADPEGLRIFLAEAGDLTVCAVAYLLGRGFSRQTLAHRQSEQDRREHEGEKRGGTDLIIGACGEQTERTVGEEVEAGEVEALPPDPKR